MPGLAGTVTLTFNTEGYGGQKVRESASIRTNDPVNPILSVAISGSVKEFAKIQPNRLTLIGSAGTVMKAQSVVTRLPEHPFRITAYRTEQKGNMRLTVTPDSSGESHTVVVENIVTEKGRFFDAVLLTTDSAVKPIIRIPVYGILR